MEDWKQIDMVWLAQGHRVKSRGRNGNHNNLHLWSDFPSEKSKAISNAQFNSWSQQRCEVKHKALIFYKGEFLKYGWAANFITIHYEKVVFFMESKVKYWLLGESAGEG